MTTLDTLYTALDQTPCYQKALQKVLTISQKPQRTIIAIAGLPGSGKSTLADYLALRANQQHSTKTIAVSMDGFHLSKAELQASKNPEEAFKRRGAPWTFNSKKFCASLKQFKELSSQALYWPSFDHSEGDPVENAILIPAETKLLIVEGLYVLHDDHGFENSQPYIDERWMIDLPFEKAMQQLAQRHQAAWGFSLEQAQERIDTNDSLNAKIAEATFRHASFKILPD